LVEAVSRRPRQPWLGGKGFVVTCVIFAFGVVVTTAIQLSQDSFVASPAQFTGAGLVFFFLIGLAARLGVEPATRVPGKVPAVWLAGLISLLVTSAFMLAGDLDLPGWPLAGIYVVGWAASIWLVHSWSRRQGWSRQHVLALASGALLTYAWHAFPQSSLGDAAHRADLAGNVLFAVLALVLLVVAWRRVAVVTPAAETAAVPAVDDERIRRDKFGDS
jgi:hypothetical protein